MPVTVQSKKKSAYKGPDPVLVRDQLQALQGLFTALGAETFCAVTPIWIIKKSAQEKEEQDYLAKKFSHWNKRLVPFVWNRMQREMYNNRTQYNIEVKYRQGGTTTFKIIVSLWMPAILEPGTSSLLISQTKGYGGKHFDILQRAHRHFLKLDPFDASKNFISDSFHQNLLHTQYSSRHEIFYDALDSRVQVDTAENTEVGQGLPGITHLVATEVARWPHQPEETMANVSESVAPEGTIDWESTPNGLGGYFYEGFQKAKNGLSIYQAKFYPWPYADEYRIDDKKRQKELAEKWKNLPTYKEAAEEEKLIIERFHLDLAQVAWRRGKFIALGKNFYEKYPEDPANCLEANSLVVLADGSKERIDRLVKYRYSGKVLTVGLDGLLTTRKVIGWHRSKRAGRKLYRLVYESGKWSGLDRAGLGMSGVTLTEDHQVLTREGWRRVDECQGKVIATGTPAPGPRAFQVILGTVLGDGSLSSRGLSCTQIVEQLIRLKARVLSKWAHSAVGRKPGGRFLFPNGHYYNCQDAWTVYTKALPYFGWLKKRFGPHRSLIPVDIVSKIDDFGLAVWFMDDGCTNFKQKQKALYPGTRPTVQLATGLLPRKQGNLVAQILNLRGYECWYHRIPGNKYGGIQFSADGSSKLLHAVAKYVPPCMRYKLPKGVPAYESHWYRPEAPDMFWDKARIRRVPVQKQKKGKYEKGPVYCLDVKETHNFVTPGGVVHNCFLTTGGMFFDTRICYVRKLECAKTKILDRNDDVGWLLFVRPVPKRSYILHADVALGKTVTTAEPDFSDYVIIDELEGYECARYHNRLPPEDYAGHIKDGAELFNNALVSVENNAGGGGETVLVTLVSQLGYSNIYMHKMWSPTQKEVVEVPGLPTSPRTRPVMLNKLAMLIREAPELIVDELFWDQALTFIRDPKGRPSAQVSCFDDMVLAEAGAQLVRLIRLGMYDPIVSPSEKYGKEND